MTLSIRSATESDWKSIADSLADAFFDDPILSWIVPARSKQQALQSFFAIEGRDALLKRGASFIAEDGDHTVGAALVAPPGHWRLPLGVQTRHAVTYAKIFRHRLPRAMALLTALERVHPREPHYFVPFIGVGTGGQGRGVGSQLLQAICERADHEQLPVYLEASSPDNVRLYRRHGFVSLSIVRPFGAPPIELMQRAPEARGD